MPPRKRPPKPREPIDGALWLALGCATVVIGTWFATLPSFPPPVTHRLPVLRVPPVPTARNGYWVWHGGATSMGKARDDLRAADIRNALARDQRMGPLAGWLVRSNPEALTALRQARHYKAFQVLPPRADPDRLDGLVQLGRLGDIACAMDLEKRRHDAALERSLDVLLLGHQLTDGHGEAAAAWLDGAAVTIHHAQMLLARPKALVRIPDAALRRYLRRLSALWKAPPPLSARVQLFQVDEARRLDDRRKHVVDDAMGTVLLGPAIALFTWQFEQLFLHRRARLEGRHLAHLAVEAAQDRDFTLLGLRADSCQAYYDRILEGPAWPATLVMHTGDYMAADAARQDRHFFEYASDPLAARVYVEGLRVAVATTLYRRKHHHEPPSLAALRPDLGALPRDPFRPSRTLGYKPHRVWSIGWDGQNQQGQPVRGMKPFIQTNYRAKGDVVITF